VRVDASVFVTRLICTCDVSHLYVRHDSGCCLKSPAHACAIGSLSALADRGVCEREKAKEREQEIDIER